MGNESLTEIIRRAIALHQAGQLAEAGQIYLAILAQCPEQADVHHNLGLLAIQIGEFSAAIYHFRHALEADPHQGKYWLSYIQTLIDMGNYAEARQVLRQGQLQEGLQGVAIEALDQLLAAPSADVVSRVRERVQQGKYLEAEREARLLIDRYPGHGFAWKILGQCLLQRGETSQALLAMQKAADLSPGDEEAGLLYAQALQRQGRFEAAVVCFEDLLRINPDHLLVCRGLGGGYLNLGRYGEAERCFVRAVALEPKYVEDLLNLGLAVQAQGRLGDAERYIHEALNISPDDARGHHYLSILLKMQGRLREAEASCRQALRVDPQFCEAYGNLGAIRFDQGCYADAEDCFAKALTIKPDYPEAFNNLGTSQHIQRKFLEAEFNYRRAIELNPSYAEAHANLGINLQSQGRVKEAELCWRRSLAINPDQLETQSGLAFHLTYSARTPDSDYLVQAQKYGQMLAEKVKTPFSDWRCALKPARLRVGLVSGDLRNHPVGQFLKGLLSQVDSTRIDFIAYATQPGTDDFSARIRPFFAEWKNIGGLSDEAAAMTVRADGIHVLIDLAGHSSHNRLSLFAWKPAPIQVSWLGYLASTGVGTIDYVLSDRHSIRLEDEKNFTEGIWRMPDSCICFTPPYPSPATNRLPSLDREIVTFGSFNNLAKMGDGVVALWSRVLQSVQNSRLYLKASQLNESAICDSTLQRFAAHGIERDRLIVAATKTNHVEHLMTYHDIDIALDTFPYPGVTTSVEALWMGVPVLTLSGDGILARAGESININAGLTDWIAEDEDDYVAKAVCLAGNRLMLSDLRSALRPRLVLSPLFDHVRFANYFDAAVWAMWDKYLEKLDGK